MQFILFYYRCVPAAGFPDLDFQGLPCGGNPGEQLSQFPEVAGLLAVQVVDGTADDLSDLFPLFLQLLAGFVLQLSVAESVWGQGVVGWWFHFS